MAPKDKRNNQDSIARQLILDGGTGADLLDGGKVNDILNGGKGDVILNDVVDKDGGTLYPGVNIHDVNDVAPTITSGGTGDALPENARVADTRAVYTAIGTSDAGAIVWSIEGADVGLFEIDASTGAVTFADATTPNYEDKTSYGFTVVATSGSRASRQDVTVAVTNVNDVAPRITSGSTGTGLTENAEVLDTTAVYTATGVSDLDPIVWSLEGADAALFNIDGASGAVTFRSATTPDSETKENYEFSVVETPGSPTSVQDASIGVTNVNDVAPQTTPGNTGPTLPENAGGGGVTSFNIDATSGGVTLRSAATPDYEAKTSYDFTVVATSGSLASRQDVTIQVTNVNDVAPTITSGSTGTALTENAEVLDTVAVYTATGTSDVDAIAWSLEGADATSFNIGSSTGVVTFADATTPDYEAKASYDFTVVATSGSLASRQDVTIQVTNVNDVAPTITSGGTGTALTENAEVLDTTAVYTATGTSDIDPIAWSLEGADAALFNIDSSTGAVTFRSATTPDSETKENYEFSVVDTPGSPTSVQDASIGVTNVNDVAPQTTPGNTGPTLPENAGGGSVTSFNIGATSGVGPLGSAITPDYEAKTSYDFTVVATSGSLASRQDVTIQVTNVNDVAPTITSGSTGDALTENAEVLDTVAVYTATGASDVDAIAWSLKDATGDVALFEIDGSTGAVTFASGTTPDYEAKSSYDFTVVATSGSLTSEQDVSIGVTNVNDIAPDITSGATGTALTENAEVADTTAVYTATGSSDVDAIAWSLEGTDAASFNIDGASGAVTFKVNTTPDYEAQASYDFTVVATSGSLVSRQDVSIGVTDANDIAPDITSGATGTGLTENAEVADTVAVYTATGVSDVDAIVWSLEGTDAASFNIDGASGAVTFKTDTTPDYEAQASYDFTVVATSGSLVSKQDVSIGVANVNDVAPDITSGGTGTALTENAEVADTVAVYTATGTSDFDDRNIKTVDAIVWSLEGADAASFNIDATGGAVTFKTATTPDYEAKASYDFTVVATSGSLTSKQDVSIGVTNVNDIAPDITSGATGAALTENAEVADTVAVYTAVGTSDVDAIVWSLEGTDAASFNIDGASGAVTFKVNTTPDYEAQASYDFTVVATSGSLVSKQDVSIGVANVNDVAPTITSGGIGTALTENAEVADTVAVYTATGTSDFDDRNIETVDAITWSLKAGTGDVALFEIDGSTGAVTFADATTPDYETKTSYDFTVVATSGSLTSEQAVTIQVTDVNDVAPDITSGGTGDALTENAEVLDTVAVYSAAGTSDLDAIVWSLKADTGDVALFEIDGSTGAVTFADATTPNYEAKTSYDFTVVATSGSLTSEQAVTIQVTDVNDVAPTISSGGTGDALTENAEVADTAAVYTAVGTSDVDAIVWSLKADTGDVALFEIDSSTGAVTFADATTPNYETKTSYDFTVVATSGSLTSEQTVTIQVTDVNDVAPTISSGGTGDALTENVLVADTAAVYTAAGTSDIDAIVWSLKADTGDVALFEIDGSTGVVTFADATTPNYEAKTSYDFTVVATSGSLTSEQAVSIQVTDVDDVTLMITSGGTGNALTENVEVADTTAVYIATKTSSDVSESAPTISSDGTSNNTFYGGELNDHFWGSSGNDTIYGLGGNNTIYGLDGADNLNGGTRSDTLNGGEGNDTLHGNGGDDILNGGDGIDILLGDAGNDVLNGGDGIDILFGDEGNDQLNGGEGNDRLSGGTGTDTLSGGAGIDRLSGGVGNDTLNGGDGTDFIDGDSGDDVLSGGEGSDSLSGGVGNDTLNGGTEIDILVGNAGADVLNGGAGADTLIGGGGNDWFTLYQGVRAASISQLDVVVDFAKGEDKIHIDDFSGASSTLAELLASASLRTAPEDRITGTTNDEFALDTVIYATNGTAATSDDVALMVIEDVAVLNLNDFTVVATPGSSVSEQAVTIQVTNVNDVAPTITSGGTGDALTEGSDTTAVYTVTETSGVDAIAWSLEGADAALFNIDAAGGAVTFRSATTPDYETKTSYDFTVVATSGSLTSRQDVSIGVTNVNDVAPQITSGGTGTGLTENAEVADTVAVYTATGVSDVDPIAWSLKADTGDVALFEIDGSTGAVTFADATTPDYEAKASYDFTVVATSGTLTSEQAVSIQVTDVNDVAPQITSGSTGTALTENAEVADTAAVYTAAGTSNLDAIVWSLKADTGDVALFEIDGSTGVVTFADVTTPDYEAKASYDFTVVATSGTLTSEQAVSIQVNDVNDVAPTITSGGTGDALTENAEVLDTTAVYTAVGTSDVDAIVWSLKDTTDDVALFEIDGSTGAVTFASGTTPDYETKTSYDFTVVATSGSLTSEQAVSIQVNDVNDVAPTITFTAPSVTALSSLNGKTGFRLDGATANDLSGRSVSSAGDVNGDGYDDVIIGAYGADNNGTSSGSSYVVFGKADGFDANLDLSSLNGTNGFRLDGEVTDDESGISVSSAGDVNGDGFDDVIVGAHWADNNDANYSGSSYVVFGKASGFDASLNLSSLNGTNGFRLDGEVRVDTSGYSVSSAGDVNNDGFDDVIISAWRADNNDVTNSGSSYVVFGKASGFSANLNLSSLDGTNGFRLDGEAERDSSGVSVSSAGDFNGDGYDDVIIGAYGADNNGTSSGSSYVVFGKASGFDADINLSSLNGTNGFRLDGEAANDLSGSSVSSAGDVNNDGFDDVIVGAHRADNNGYSSGSSYVVFGKASGFSVSLNLFSLDGTNGFRLDGAAGDKSGSSVSSAGDFNGDGFDDLIIGAPNAGKYSTNIGSSYVVFGKASGFDADINLSSLDGTNGFRLDGASSDDESGNSVSSAGDVNGDGFDDIIVGASGAEHHAKDNDSGSSYIVFGYATSVSVNDVAPTITSGSTGTGLTENAEVADTTAVYTATADVDAIVWSLKDATGDVGLFEIDGSTGAVTFADATTPDYEAKTSYDFTVVATSGSLTSEQAVSIQVTDVNEAPILGSVTAAGNVAENDIAAAISGISFTPSDDDTSQTAFAVGDFTLESNEDLSVLSHAQVNALFEVVALSTSGAFGLQLKAGQQLDYEGRSSYGITVKVRDDDSAEAAADLTINVINVDETDASVAIARTTGSGTVASGDVYTATIMADLDLPTVAGNYSYQWLRDGGDISGATGQTYTLTSADVGQDVSVRISYTDPATSSAKTASSTAVTVPDNIGTAITLTNSNLSIAENTDTAGAIKIADLDITDVDGGSYGTLALAGADAGKFELNGTVLSLKAGTALDYETDPSLDVRVQLAEDNAIGTDVVVNVTNVNDVAPQITSGGTGTALTENAEVADTTAVYTAAGVSDVDAIAWSLEGTDAASFNIDATGGAVTFANATTPDYETKASYDFTVVATSGSLTSRQAVSIEVTDVNDVTPTITSGATGTALTENAEVADTTAVYTATTLGSLTSRQDVTLNGDDGNDILVGGEGGDTLKGRRGDDTLNGGAGADTLKGGRGDDTLNGGAGADTLKGGPGDDGFTLYQGARAASISQLDVVIDFAKGEDKIHIDDLGGASSTLAELLASTSLRTAPEDRITGTTNDEFALDTVIYATNGTAATSDDVALMVIEDVAVLNRNDFTVVATPGSPVSEQAVAWSLEGADAASFNIDATGGAVTFANATTPDYETKSSYDFTVVATSGSLTSRQDVSIGVTNVNDIAPDITSGATGTGLTENAEVADTVAVYTAAGVSDVDAIAWSLKADTGDVALFEINSSTGVVTFADATTPDYETKTSYDFTVVATSGSLTSEQAVSIQVIDVNDVTPQTTFTPPSVIALSSLNGKTGFRLDGETAVDLSLSGASVSNAGDVNNDGFDDVIIGAYFAGNDGGRSGSSYVVFGKASGFGASLNLSSLDGTNGLRLDGETWYDYSGISVSSAGDVNNDGFDDVIIGAEDADNNGNRSGSSYVVFGKASGFSASLNLSSLNGTNGFRLDGESAHDFSGTSVSSAGDVNGDGYDDIIIGAHNAEKNGEDSGSSYVVFGKASGFSASLNLSSLNGTNGFRLDGESPNSDMVYYYLGYSISVSSAGDVNGDGYDDVIIGEEHKGNSSGSSYVVFGKASGFSASLNLSSLDGSNGFRIDGETAVDASGYSISNAGDVNGDGYDDLIIGAPMEDNNGTNSGSSYVVFGKASGFSASLNLSSLDGTNGFRIDGESGSDYSGKSVSSAGDFNGDGYDDVIIGVDVTGSSYVVFGKASGFDANLDLSSLNGTNGIKLDGESESDSGYSVSSAGDVNSDGYDDLIIGAPWADNNGNGSGSSYIVFGYATSASVNDVTPTITSGSTGTGLTENVLVADTAAVYTAAGTSNLDAIVWSLKADTGDVALFEIDGSTGVVTFADATTPDYEAKTSYDFTVVATSGTLTSEQAVSIQVTNVNDVAPTITYSGTGDGLTENAEVLDTVAVYTVTGVSDVDAIVWSLEGTDAASLNIDATSGAVTFVNNTTPDYEAKTSYDFTVVATSGSLVSRQDATIGVINVNDVAPTITSGGTGDALTENAEVADATVVYTAAGVSDVDAIAWSLEGADAASFNIDTTTGGAVTFRSATTPDYETKTSYDFTVVATSGSLISRQDVSIQVIDVNEVAPQITFTAPSVTALSSLNGKTGFRLDGAGRYDGSGESVSSAGDVNGDGFDDVIVGAGAANNNGALSGSSYVVFGKTGGFDASLNLSSLNGTNGFRLDGEVAGDWSGTSVSSAGDVNGDGFDDVIIGAYHANKNGTNSGASYVVFGKTGGFDANIDLSSLNGTNGFRLDGESSYDYGGWSVSSAGDVNNDGFDDVIIGAKYADSNGSNSGASYVVFGKANGFGANLNLSNLDGTNGFRLDGEYRDESGESVSSAGDVNGDGFDDLIIGATRADENNATNSGSSYVVFGKASGFNASFNLSSLNGTNGFRLDGEAAGDFSGHSVSSAGDFNGDGYDDLIISAHFADNNGYRSGSSYVVFGKASGFYASLNLSSLNGTNGFRLDGEAAGDFSGHSVSSAGDFNGDGFDDLIIGALNVDSNGSNSGASYVVFGKAGGFDASLNLSSLNGTNGFRLDGEAADDRSGKSVSSAGDVNGDGFDDLIIGASGADHNVIGSGSSYIVFGYATSVSVNDAAPQITFTAPSVIALSSLNGKTGFRLDGEARDDYSGFSVSSAGDVNGDGFDDVIIGAYGADNYRAYSGSSYVVFGKADGFDASLNLSNLEAADGFRLDGESAQDTSGISVSSAGDVNGDGFDDVIVGADWADPNGVNSGSSYVVFGKADGFDASLNLSNLNGTNGFRLDGESADDVSGTSVSSAGDVNGDGYDDLIIGAYKADNNGSSSGSSYVAFGKAEGFDASLDLSRLDGTNGFRLDGESAWDISGISVSSAGDFNDDGYDDVIIGAYRADNNGANSGSSYVVFGKAEGFDASLDLSRLDGTNGFRLDGEAAFDKSGRSVSSAGDFNGDGFDDLIIGAGGADNNGSSSGSSYVVFGKAEDFDASLDLSRLDGTNGFRLDGEAASDYSGKSVSSAGDFNGDGFDDLIIGAAGADNNGSSSGSSYVVFGKAEDFDASLDLSRLDGTNGFRLDGVFGDNSGRSVSSAGDVNDDGFDDLIIGAPADNNGSYSGSSYIVFGYATSVSVNDVAPTITSGGTGNALTEEVEVADATAVYTAAGTSDVDAIVWSLKADTGDVALFEIDGSTGAVTFADATTPDYEAKASYDFTVVATSGSLTSEQAVSIQVIDVNDVAPTITSGGTGDALTENAEVLDTVAVYTAAGTSDLDAIVWSLKDATGDVALFNINSSTGAVTFRSATTPDYETKTSYDFTVVATSGSLTSEQAVSIQVTNINDVAPTISSGGTGDALTENVELADTTVVYTAAGTSDIDAIAWSLKAGTGDVALFEIDGSTGAVTFADATTPDYETKSGYGFTVVATSGSLTSEQAVCIHVTDVNDVAPTISSGGTEDYFHFTAPTVTALSSLNGKTGFRLDGEVEDDYSGKSVSSAGDINGDGFGDVIIGARNAGNNGDHSGDSYVVFGKAGGFDASLNLSSLNGTNGFRLDGEAEDDYRGISVSSAGDVNGDGYDDLIIGAARADNNGSRSGSSYVVFGKTSRFDASLNLSNLEAVDGFRLDGEARGDNSGRSVSSAGDVNGDGYDDVIIGATYAGNNGLYSGSSYVVFGKASNFGTSLNLSRLDGTNGFRLDGEAAGVQSGRSVSGAGDVNSDGFDDLIIGAPYTGNNGVTNNGSSYVVFGKAEGFEDIDLSDLKNSDGFRLDGNDKFEESGYSVSSAGDVNGDGFDDVIIGGARANNNGGDSGSSYVVFGKAEGFEDIDLSDLKNSDGFRIDGEAIYDFSGLSVSSAGDFNGDGFDDLIIGAPFADNNGSWSGSSYVVFGKASGFSANLNLSSLNGSNGFRLDGETADDQSGYSVSNAGDVNGDGFDDIIVGAHWANNNGDYSGSSYVVFGYATSVSVIGSVQVGETLTASNISGENVQYVWKRYSDDTAEVVGSSQNYILADNDLGKTLKVEVNYVNFNDDRVAFQSGLTGTVGKRFSSDSTDQTIIGTVGNDVYVYDEGDGNDTITDAGGEDQFRFGSDILVGDVTFNKTGNDLKITISDDDTATADHIVTVTNWTVEANRVEEFIFDDDTIKTDEAILADIL